MDTDKTAKMGLQPRQSWELFGESFSVEKSLRIDTTILKVCAVLAKNQSHKDFHVAADRNVRAPAAASPRWVNQCSSVVDAFSDCRRRREESLAYLRLKSETPHVVSYMKF